MHLIKDIRELKYIDKDETLVAENLVTFYKITNRKKIYLHCFADKSNYKFYDDFSKNWFLSNKKKDLTIVNGISYGFCSGRTFVYKSINLLKIYLSLKKISKRNERIFIFRDKSELVKNIDIIIKFNKDLRKKIVFKNINFKQFNISSTPERGIMKLFKLNFVLIFFRMIQKVLFIFFKKKKILYFSDWHTKEEYKKNNNLLIRNNINPLKSFYFNYFSHKSKYQFKDFLKIMKIKLNFNSIKKVFVKHNIKFDEKLFHILSYLFQQTFKENKKIIKQYENIIHDLLDFYKPNAIILSDGCTFHNRYFLSVSKNRDIKTILSLDGYQTFQDYEPIAFNKIKKNTEFNHIIAYGERNKNFLLKSGVKKQKLINSISPIVLRNIKKKKKIYDAMIIGYVPFTNSLYTTYDSYINTEMSVLKILSDLKCKNVAIKIKSSDIEYKETQPRNLKLYSEIYRNKFKEKLNVSLFFETGTLLENVNRAKIVIGQLGTALYETSFAGIPYYVYEPQSNGLSFKDIDHIAIEQNFVATKNYNLKKNILKKNYVKIPRSEFSIKNKLELKSFFDEF